MRRVTWILFVLLAFEGAIASLTFRSAQAEKAEKESAPARGARARRARKNQSKRRPPDRPDLKQFVDETDPMLQGKSAETPTPEETPLPTPVDDTAQPSAPVPIEPRWTGANDIIEAFTLNGLIRDQSSGVPVAGARVSVGARTARTNKDGIFELEIPRSDRAIVYVRKRGFLTATRSLQTGEPVTIGIWPGIAVKGSVVDSANSEPIAGVHVDCGTDNTRTDARGRFELTSCSAGEAILTATHDKYSLKQVSLGTIAARMEVSNANIALEQVPSVRIVAGHVVLDGHAQSDVEVTLDCEDPARAKWVTRTNLGGAFQFRDIPMVACVARANHPQLGAISVRAPLDEETVAFSLESARSIYGQVIDPEGAVRAVDGTVIATGLSGDTPKAFSAEAIRGGFHFVSLPPGDYQLTTSLKNAAAADPLIVSTDDGGPIIVSWTLPLGP